MMASDKKSASIAIMMKKLSGGDTMESMKNHNEHVTDGGEVSGEEIAAQELIQALDAKDSKAVVIALESLIQIVTNKM